MVLYNLMPMVGVTWIDVSLPMFLGQKTGTLKLKGIKNSCLGTANCMWQREIRKKSILLISKR